MPALKQKFYSSPPKDKLVIEKRIIDGKMRKVETWNGKVARVYDEEGKLLEDRSGKLKITLPTPPLEPKVMREKKLDYTSEEDKSQEMVSQVSTASTSSIISTSGTSGTVGLQLVPEDEVIKHDIDSSQTDASQCPECKSKNIDTLLHLENAIRYKCRDCNETFVIDKEKNEPPKTNDDQKIETRIEPKTPEEISGTTPEISQKLENLINIQDISNKVYIPKIEPPKEISNKTVVEKETPKKVEIPKEVQEMVIPGVPVVKVGNRIEKLIDNKMSNNQIVVIDNKANNKIKTDIPKSGDKILETITTTVKAEQQKNQVENKKIIKENKSMAEEILEEYKREQWAKKRDFEKNIEDMARVAAENKDQISGISHKIGDVEGKLGDVDNKIGNLQDNFQQKFGNLQENLQEKLGNIKKPVSDALGELCTGVDCIKSDLRKTQEYQQTYQQTLDKQLEHRFKELSERLEKLEEPSYVCDNCGQDDIRPLSSFCPNCGAPIHSWTDPETGMPVSGWAPFWKRQQRFSSQEQ